MQRAPGDFGTGRPAARAISVSWTRDVCFKKMHKRHCRRQIYTRCISGHVHNKTLLAGDRIPNNQKIWGYCHHTHRFAAEVPSLPELCDREQEHTEEFSWTWIRLCAGAGVTGRGTQLVRECQGQIQRAWFILHNDKTSSSNCRWGILFHVWWLVHQ